MEPHDLQTFIDDVGLVVRGSDDQYEITKRVAQRLSALLAGGYRLPPEFIRPSPVRHLTYPLYIAPDDSWSLASVVWNVGQQTPVHGHETWGVVGIYSGAEREIRYVKPAASAVGRALTPAGEHVWERGQVTVCCTTDDDVHAVTAVGDEPTVGIHVYGGNIGTINRPSYDPATGAIQWFVSGWDHPAVDGSQPRAFSNSRGLNNEDPSPLAQRGGGQTDGPATSPPPAPARSRLLGLDPLYRAAVLEIAHLSGLAGGPDPTSDRPAEQR